MLSPFPPPWLQHAAVVLPMWAINLLMRTSKYHRVHLRHNTPWLQRCEELKQFAQLTVAERQTRQLDYFWYDWYQKRMPRKIKIMPAVTIEHDLMPMKVPTVGTLMASEVSDRPKYVVIFASGYNFALAEITEKIIGGYATFNLSSKQTFTLRKTGNFSMRIRIFNPLFM